MVPRQEKKRFVVPLARQENKGMDLNVSDLALSSSDSAYELVN